ncbi:MAG: methionine--tRNA ligase [Acidimicrobiia bacterium]
MNDPFYITTPIYYVNDSPHMGGAYTTISADVAARWHRLLGDDVMFLTGTDEHGLKLQRAAQEQEMSPQELVDFYSKRYIETWSDLNISNDDFVRTTEPRHKVAVQALLQKVYDNGFIELNTYEGLYCVACEAYYTEDDLIDGLCKFHNKPVETVKEENYFFKLSAFQDRLAKYYEENPQAIEPLSRRNEVLSFINSGLRDFSISRSSLSWGIPIPWDQKHVTYVWFDALTNYITALEYPNIDSDLYKKFWPGVHFVGKDILRFHAVYWPAMMMAAELEPPKQVFAHGFLTVGGEKMSKSKANQIVPSDLTPTFGVDGYRYHFVADQRFGGDGDFSYEQMVARYNSDLANNFGNLTARVLNMAIKYCDGLSTDKRANGPLKNAIAQTFEKCETLMGEFNFSEFHKTIWELIGACNSYIEQTEPFKMAKEDMAGAQAVLGDCLEALRAICLFAYPAMPATCEELWRRLGLNIDTPIDKVQLPRDLEWGSMPAGLPLEKGESLFPRIVADES